MYDIHSANVDNTLRIYATYIANQKFDSIEFLNLRYNKIVKKIYYIKDVKNIYFA